MSKAIRYAGLSGLREEVKNQVAKDLFDKFDFSEIHKNIDFCVKLKNLFDKAPLLYAQVKKVKKVKVDDKYLAKALVQIILTIRKHNLHKDNTPCFLASFNAKERINHFIPLWLFNAKVK